MLLYLGDILFLAVKTWPNNFFKNDMVYVAYQLIDNWTYTWGFNYVEDPLDDSSSFHISANF